MAGGYGKPFLIQMIKDSMASGPRLLLIDFEDQMPVGFVGLGWGACHIAQDDAFSPAELIRMLMWPGVCPGVDQMRSSGVMSISDSMKSTSPESTRGNTSPFM
jgi:hypothetical protein